MYGEYTANRFTKSLMSFLNTSPWSIFQVMHNAFPPALAGRSKG